MSTYSVSWQRDTRSKIVATVGPACDTLEGLCELIQAGVDVFRVNTAHGEQADHQRRVDLIRAAEQTTGKPTAILVDLAGPKMRLGTIPGDVLVCDQGMHVAFIRGQTTNEARELTCTYEPLLDELRPGNRVMLADGTVTLQVISATKDRAECEVVQAGTVRSRQGVNLPGVKLGTPALSARDREFARWAAASGIDYLGLSFVRHPQDVIDLKLLLASTGVKNPPHIIAKIEKPEALARLDEVVAAADGVMVARGDLGVEIDIAEIAAVQKRIVAACNKARKPVIIATQMLDSMHHSRLPTRAEATDVANAILDGADACMLSGETAVGQYPRAAVEMMRRIASATEPLLKTRPTATEPPKATPGVSPITEASARAAGQLAEELQAKLIVIASSTGNAALSLSKNRRFVPTIGVSDNSQALRRMCLYWGVIPLQGAPATDDVALLEFIMNRGRKRGDLASGDRIVLMSGTGLPTSRHNMVVVHEVE